MLLDSHLRKELIAKMKDHYRRESIANGNRLKRHEIWQQNYLRLPYLTQATETRLTERHSHLVSTMYELAETGLFNINPAITNNAWLMERYTGLNCEYLLRDRDLPPPDEKSKNLMESYHAKGEPLGVKLFRGFHKPDKFFIVKLGNKKHLTDMFFKGQIRVSTAARYLESSNSKAATDNEVKREFILPTFDALERGIESIEVDGEKYSTSNGEILITREFPNYYLFSTCNEIDCRLPTDFSHGSEYPYDAALVIYNPKKFIKNLLLSFFEKHKNYSASHGFVDYYDPYMGPKNFAQLEMSKHFSYLYQKEYRIIFRPNTPVSETLDYVSLSVGSLQDDATLLTI